MTGIDYKVVECDRFRSYYTDRVFLVYSADIYIIV